VVKVFTSPWTSIFTAREAVGEATAMGSKPGFFTLALSE
jgi:hypothetical protein